jgi:hypothetical protein
MKRTRMTGIILAGALGLNALAATSVQAALPEFTVLPSIKKYTELISPGTDKAGGNTVTCEGGSATGEITGMRTVGKITFKLKGCVSSGSGGSGCPINTPGAGEGELVSTTLKGELGTVKASEALTLVGDLAEPETGKKWMTLVANKCTPEVSLTGTIAGEVGPVNKLTTKGFINFVPGKIKQISVLSGLVEPDLMAFSEEVEIERFETLSSTEPMEID